MRQWVADKGWYLAFWLGVTLLVRYWLIPALAAEIAKRIGR